MSRSKAKMGNLHNGNVVVTQNSLFLKSINESYITHEIIKEVVLRWREMGRPIQLSPTHFKDRIIGEQFKDALKINYQKWL